MIKTLVRISVVALALTGAVGASKLPPAAANAEAVREIEIVVDDGYSPTEITIKESERVKLTFVRKGWSGCTRELVFPKLDIRRTLAPNESTTVDLPALAAGTYDFRCGMNMIRGKITVTAR